MGFFGTTEAIVVVGGALLIFAPTLFSRYVKAYKKAKVELQKNDIIKSD